MYYSDTYKEIKYHTNYYTSTRIEYTPYSTDIYTYNNRQDPQSIRRPLCSVIQQLATLWTICYSNYMLEYFRKPFYA